ncbi:MAG: saccharopine dehydrogenase, partial [Myxococcota bacterium]
GRRAAARLETPEGYTTTAYAALALAKRVTEGQLTTGFQTPAKAYGPDLILQVVAGCVRTDLE